MTKHYRAALPIDDLMKVLACPDAQHPLRVSMPNYPGTRFLHLECPRVGKGQHPVVYAAERGIVNLLPQFLENGSQGIAESTETSAFVFTDDSGGRIYLSRSQVWDTLEAASKGDLRSITAQMQRVVEHVPYDRGQMRSESVKLVAKGLETLYQTYQDKLSPQGRQRLLSSVSMARYIAELEFSKDYRGNFVAPDSVLDKIPKRAVIAEIGMGNGANLRKAVARRNPKVAIGIDNCFGMVDAAERMTEDPRIVNVLADAQYLPIQKGSLDALLMFNVIDRLTNGNRVIEHIRQAVKPGGIVIIANCSPLQYEISMGDVKIPLVEPEDRFVDVMHFALKVGIGNPKRILDIPWHPETELQGKEDLKVNIVFGNKA